MTGVYYMLWGPLMEEARKTGPEAEALYRRNLTFLSAVWAGYPVNWLMGPEGLALFDEDRSTGIYTGLDITAKVLFGLYSLSNTQEKAAREFADGRVPEHEMRPSPASHVESWERGSPTEGDAAPEPEPEAKPEPRPRRTRGKARAKPDSETA
jgi:bacteriorhodopsin